MFKISSRGLDGSGPMSHIGQTSSGLLPLQWRPETQTATNICGGWWKTRLGTKDWIDELIRDMDDPTWPLEVRSLGRTLKNWRNDIIAWHKIQISNGPTEGANNLIKRVTRVAFGFRSFRNFHVRVLLYAERPDW